MNSVYFSIKSDQFYRHFILPFYTEMAFIAREVTNLKVDEMIEENLSFFLAWVVLAIAVTLILQKWISIVKDQVSLFVTLDS